MKIESIKALDDAVFKLQRTRNDMEFYAGDDNALHFQNLYMEALNTYLNCIDACHKEAMPLLNYKRHEKHDESKSWDILDDLTGHKFKRIP